MAQQRVDQNRIVATEVETKTMAESKLGSSSPAAKTPVIPLIGEKCEAVLADVTKKPLEPSEALLSHTIAESQTSRETIYNESMNKVIHGKTSKIGALRSGGKQEAFLVEAKSASVKGNEQSATVLKAQFETGTTETLVHIAPKTTSKSHRGKKKSKTKKLVTDVVEMKEVIGTMHSSQPGHYQCWSHTRQQNTTRLTTIAEDQAMAPMVIDDHNGNNNVNELKGDGRVNSARRQQYQHGQKSHGRLLTKDVIHSFTLSSESLAPSHLESFLSAEVSNHLPHPTSIPIIHHPHPASHTNKDNSIKQTTYNQGMIYRSLHTLWFRVNR